jgi:hypothetical protein
MEGKKILQDQTDYISAGKFGGFTEHIWEDFPGTRSRIGSLYKILIH